MNVLLVDDEPAILWTLGEILKGCGFTVMTAPNAQAAKTALSAQNFDVVITDMNMETREAGYEVARMAVTRSPRTVVIIISAYSLNSNWREHGAHAFLEKPFPTELLLSTIQQLRICGATASPVNGDGYDNADAKPQQIDNSTSPGERGC